MTLENPHPTDGLVNSGYFRNPEKIIVLDYTKLELPTKFYDELILNGQEPSSTAVSIIKAGILADRGVLVQPIGGEELIVSVQDAAQIPFGTRKNHQTKQVELDTKPVIHLAANASTLIAQTSKLFPTNEASSSILNQWFIKAISLWQRFEGTDLMHFRLDQDTAREFNLEQLERTWSDLGFPESRIEGFGKGLFALKTLYFKERSTKSADLLPSNN